MNEMHFAYKIRQQLNRGLHELPASSVSRLEVARQCALARQRVVVHQSVLAGAGSFLQQHVEQLRLKQLLLAQPLKAPFTPLASPLPAPSIRISMKMPQPTPKAVSALRSLLRLSVCQISPQRSLSNMV